MDSRSNQNVRNSDRELISRISRNVEMTYFFMSRFFNTYTYIINNGNNAENLFVEAYWEYQLRQQILKETQLNHDSNVKTLKSELMKRFIVAYKRYIDSSKKLKENDKLLLKRIFGIVDTDVFKQSVQIPKINGLWPIITNIYKNGAKRGNLESLIIDKDVANYLASQRAGLRNNGLQSAVEIFDEIFCWSDYSNFIVQRYNLRPART